MSTLRSELQRPGQEFVVEALQGRVTVRLTNEALRAMGAVDGDAQSLSSTLDQHMPRLRALAMQLAGRSRCKELTIRSADIWWSSWRR